MLLHSNGSGSKLSLIIYGQHLRWLSITTGRKYKGIFFDLRELCRRADKRRPDILWSKHIARLHIAVTCLRLIPPLDSIARLGTGINKLMPLALLGWVDRDIFGSSYSDVSLA